MATTPAVGKSYFFGQNWPQIYSEELYKQGGSYEERVCPYQFDGPHSDKQACIGETNAIMAILEAEVIYPLREIPDLHNRIQNGLLRPKLGEEITNIFFNRMKFLAPPPDSALGPQVLGLRDNLRTRTINLMRSQPQLLPLVEDLTEFYQRHLFLDQPSASAAITGCKESIADTIACWTALCIIRGTVRGDGTYTVRNRIGKAQTGTVGSDRSADQRAAAPPQGRIAVISPEEYQRQVQEGKRATEPLPPALVAAHEQREQFYMRVEQANFKAQQDSYARESSYRQAEMDRRYGK